MGPTDDELLTTNTLLICSLNLLELPNSTMLLIIIEEGWVGLLFLAFKIYLICIVTIKKEINGVQYIIFLG